MKEALVYEKLKGKIVRCGVCQRRCSIADGQTGFCLTKINKKGELFSLTYGLIQGVQLDPVEKKPFYHFKPGTFVPSIGSLGCNFRCKQCLNWECTWGEPAQTLLRKIPAAGPAEIVSPQDLISQIEKSGHSGIAFTYNEPVIWSEYVLDVAKLAKKAGFFTLFVTNGSWTKQTINLICPFIDAANIDFKGFSRETYAKMGAFWGLGKETVPEMAKYAQEKYHVFLEITTLLIPGINDNPNELEAMAKWIVKNLGPKTPWHLSRFDPNLAPDKDFQKIPPTPIESLKKAAEIGRKAGLNFVYIWAPGADLENGLYSEGNTVCPKCKNLAIKRDGWRPELVGLDKKGCCDKCGESLNIKL